MGKFNEYHKDPRQFPFLTHFQAHWEAIRDEFTRFINTASPAEMKLASEVMGPKSKTITTRKKNKYSAFGFFFQGLFLEDYIQSHGISYKHYGDSEVLQNVVQVRQHYFPQLIEAINIINRSHASILRNVYFGTFYPGLDIKLHINDNPHLYRGYLGLIVPPGDVAMKICHETLFWHEGEIMILDHRYPHCPHNYTNENRTVLVIDFFKPDKPRQEVLQIEQAQVTQRMQDNPYSLGIFGQSDQAKEEDFIQYGLAHQLEWDKVL